MAVAHSFSVIEASAGERTYEIIVPSESIELELNQRKAHQNSISKIRSRAEVSQKSQTSMHPSVESDQPKPSAARLDVSRLRGVAELEGGARVSRLRFSNAEDMQEAIKLLEEEGLEWEPNHEIRATVDPFTLFNMSTADELFPQQWSMVNLNASSSSQVAGASIDVIRAWSISRGRGRLYVVDTGVDPGSQEFSQMGLYLADFVGEGLEDFNGHGTHVASIAVARENGIGIIGVAPGDEVDLVSIKVLNANSQGSTHHAINAMDELYRDIKNYFQEDPSGFAVINLSLGGGGHSAQFERSLQKISQLGAGQISETVPENYPQGLGGPRVLTVAAAGNNGVNNDQMGFYPCNFNVVNLMCVAASDPLDYLAPFSNFGPKTVHLLAPGVQIYGNIPGFLAASSSRAFVRKNGTSQAAPHVSGASLLVHGANPALDASQVKAILLGSVDQLPGGSSEVKTGGRLNAYRAVLLATGEDPERATQLFESRPGYGEGGCQIQLRSDTPAPLGLVLFAVLYALLWGFRTRFQNEKI